MAGKFAWGARTATDNLVIGLAYTSLGFVDVGLLVAFPKAMLGVILVLVAIELGRASLQPNTSWLVAFVGLVGFLSNIGVALVAGVVVDRLSKHVSGL